MRTQAKGETPEKCLAKVEELKQRDFIPLHEKPKFFQSPNIYVRPYWFVMMETTTPKPKK